MIETAVRDRVIAALWPAQAASPTPTTVWAVLDCARDPRIYPALRNSRLDYRSLYSGRVPHELEAVAPHLVELAPGYAFTTQLIEMGWGQSWGVFVRIADPSNLRAHLRTLLRVQDEAKRFLIFRYYDPRVLRVYLPTCLPEELETVFGDIDRYLAEDETGTNLLEFRFDGSALQQRSLPI